MHTKPAFVAAPFASDRYAGTLQVSGVCLPQEPVDTHGVWVDVTAEDEFGRPHPLTAPELDEARRVLAAALRKESEL